MLASLSTRYDDIISWAEVYDTASSEAKMMIVNPLISRVEVPRGHKVHVELGIDFQQFLMGDGNRPGGNRGIANSPFLL